MDSDTIRRVTTEERSGVPPAVAFSSPFPESPRVIYEENPLVEVVCQVRFPPILRVDVELPAAFQDRIRSEYPVLKDRSNEALGLPPQTPTIVANLVRSMNKQRTQSAYDFISADGAWTVSLTREFLALSTTSYRRWEKFKARLDSPFRALLKEYSPAWFSRVGLRYQNVVRRSALGLATEPWSALLQPQLTGILSAGNMHAEVVESMTQTVIQFPGGTGNVNLRHGLIPTGENEEICYLIDNDFFADNQTRAEDVYTKLDFFNQQSGSFFRWCIADRLHNAMGPKSLESARDDGEL